MIYSKAKFDDKCHNTAVILSSVTFYHNEGETGGSIYCQDTNSLRFIGNTYFNESLENAITSHTWNISFVGTTYIHL